MWIFEIESFKFPITVLIKDPNQDLFLRRKAKKKIGYSDDTWWTIFCETAIPYKNYDLHLFPIRGNVINRTKEDALRYLKIKKLKQNIPSSLWKSYMVKLNRT